MYIRQLECFVQLCETLNFNTTAELLYISQPAVSHQIKTLEEELGLKLFIRSKRDVSLTPAGLSFYNDIKDILTKTNLAIAKARNYSKDFKSNFSICCEGNLLELELLPCILNEFTAENAYSQLYIKHGDYKESRNALLSQKHDIIFTVEENIMDYPEIHYEQLIWGRFVCVLSSSNPLSLNSTISLKHLQEESLILLDPIKSPPEMSRFQNEIQLFCPNATTYYCDSSVICYTMIKGNMGIAVMPDFVCPNDSKVKVIPLDIPYRISYGIAWNASNSKSEIRSFLKTAKAIYEKSVPPAGVL
ncbi:LysR family transcriptional regulator [Lacrimispora sp.]|uniref:LysR family transcriptional regulator n=1 Tax=Lacrimispora sp. TaxID=2719234 RepID=UPI0032E50212